MGTTITKFSEKITFSDINQPYEKNLRKKKNKEQITDKNRLLPGKIRVGEPHRQFGKPGETLFSSCTKTRLEWRNETIMYIFHIQTELRFNRGTPHN